MNHLAGGCAWVLLGALAAGSAAAADWTSLYPVSQMLGEKPRLEQVLRGTISQEIEPYFTPEQRRSFFDLEVNLLLDNKTASPIEFDLPRTGEVTIPLVTLLFVEDLAKAYAWLWANRCSSETIDEYTAMLRYRRPADFPGGRYPAPLEALHVPAGALENPDVKKMFLRMRNTAFSFMLLHQLGLQRGEGPASADLFALDLMRRNSETPMGLLLLMSASVHLPEDRDPVTPARLHTIADYLDLRVLDFVQGRSDRDLARRAINAVAKSLREAATFLNDPVAKDTWADRARSADVATLTPKRQEAGR
jgi:hypothetical protein